MVATAPVISKSPINARQAAWIRALDRARLVSTESPIYLATKDAYSVYSAHSDNDYVVEPTEVNGHITYKCDCQAGEKGLVCWHAALTAAEPREVGRRATHRAARQVAKGEVVPASLAWIDPAQAVEEARILIAELFDDAAADSAISDQPAKNGHELLMECFG